MKKYLNLSGMAAGCLLFCGGLAALAGIAVAAMFGGAALFAAGYLMDFEELTRG